MKQTKTQSSPYFEIINKTKSCIVINGLKLILKPSGESGDSIIVDEAKSMDNEVIGLQSANLIKISVPRARKPKKEKKIKDNAVEGKKRKVEVNDKKGSSVTYIDRGKVRKGKMTRTIQDLRMVNPDGSGEDVEADAEENKPNQAFIDQK